MLPIDTTPPSIGSIERETIVCSAPMICADTTIGSMPWCGDAAVAALAGDDDVEESNRRHHRTEPATGTCRLSPPASCAARTPCPSGNARTVHPSPSCWRRPRIPPPAGKSDTPCRRNCASPRDTSPPQAAWWYGRRVRTHASRPGFGWHAPDRSPPGSAARPCPPAGRSPAPTIPPGSHRRRRASAIPVMISSTPNSASFARTTPEVRASCIDSSGWACRSLPPRGHLGMQCGDAVDDRHVGLRM